MKKILLILILILFVGGCNDKTTKHNEHGEHGITKEEHVVDVHNETIDKHKTPHGAHNATGEKAHLIENVINDRRSVRRFNKEKVDFEKIEKIITLATRAPSAGDLQAYKIYVVTNEKVRFKLTKNALGQYSVYSAPHSLVFVALPDVSAEKYSARGRALFCVQDATIVAAYVQLLLQNAGISSVWIGSFRPEGVQQTLELPKNEIPVVIMPFGYPESDRHVDTERKPISEITKYITD